MDFHSITDSQINLLGLMDSLSYIGRKILLLAKEQTMLPANQCILKIKKKNHRPLKSPKRSNFIENENREIKNTQRLALYIIINWLGKLIYNLIKE